jgi:hypothetical protein
MRNTIRLILASIAGIILSFFVIKGAEGIVAKYYPLNTLNPTIKDLIEQAKTMPTKGLLMVLAGYIVSSFMGGYLAARLSPEGKKQLGAFVVGFFLLLSGIVMFISIPHPLWLTIASCVSYLAFSYLGGKTAGA